MAESADSPVTQWAILIGINYYVEDRCLGGAVQDVKRVKEYLETQPSPVKTIILTATTPSDPNSGRPVEGPTAWPTYDNVISALQGVICKAKRGHTVYIHYSGHGTRTESPVDAAGAGSPSSELALVLFEEQACSYFRGRTLAHAIKKLVDIGVIVTLVLDCCFSGSVPRGPELDEPAEVRWTEYRPVFDVHGSQECEDDLVDDLDDGYRKAILSPEKWLLDPEGYAILAACGPHEKAWELKLKDGQRRGALSYFLLGAVGTIREAGARLTHQLLYHHLRTRFQASWPRQTPMQYGNRSLALLGRKGVDSDDLFVSVFRDDKNRLLLSAGHAHGLHIGDEYTLYPASFTNKAVNGTTAAAAAPEIRAKVSTVNSLTSELVEIESGSALRHVETGWKAKLVKLALSQTIGIGVILSVLEQLSWEEDAFDSVFFRFLVDGQSSDEVCTFHLILNARNEYEVLDASRQTIDSLPTVPHDVNGAPNAVLEMLRHISVFRFFECIENRDPDPAFESSFSLTVTPPPEDGVRLSLADGDEWRLLVQNFSEKPLYVNVFNLRASWEIVSVLSDGGQGDFFVVAPQGDDDNGREEEAFEMEVPQDALLRGKDECQDVVKVFITSRATSFATMLLGEMSLSVEELLERTETGGKRGEETTLGDFLTQIDMDTHGDNNARVEDWTCKNFIIRTTARKVIKNSGQDT